MRYFRSANHKTDRAAPCRVDNAEGLAGISHRLPYQFGERVLALSAAMIMEAINEGLQFVASGATDFERSLV
jgi:hypothetical protein